MYGELGIAIGEFIAAETVATEGIGAEVLLQVGGGEAYGEVYLEAEGAKVVLVACLHQAGAVLDAQAEADL